MITYARTLSWFLICMRNSCPTS